MHFCVYWYVGVMDLSESGGSSAETLSTRLGREGGGSDFAAAPHVILSLCESSGEN